MSKQEQSETSEGRPELPIERGFPIERVNEIAEKESRAKQWYRPVYTMHKWWARRPGCLFRAITLYSLLDEDTTLDDVEVYEPGENQILGDNGLSKEDLIDSIDNVSMDNPETLWEFYPKDIRIQNKKILDPFMGGGTSLVEASRFGVNSVGVDLNPVAWFVSKKELEAGQTNVEDLEEAFEQVKSDVADEILQYYTTPCPNGDHDADIMYNFWVKNLDCVACGHTVPLFKDYRVAAGRYENDDKYNVLCPECDTVTLVSDWQEDSECGDCGYEFVPKNGNVTRGGYYNCPECGQKESISDAAHSQGGYNLRLYGIEYYCDHCEQQGLAKSSYKGYKQAEPSDKNLFEEAKRTWETRKDLHKYIPKEEIPDGWKTTSGKYSGSAPGAGDVRPHGYEKWEDMFNERQLLSLSTLLKSISEINCSQNVQEYLLLAFSDALRTNTMMSSYQFSVNKSNHIFKTNSFDPPNQPCEGNVWGTEFGMGTFESIWEMVKKGVKYANAPTERFIENGDTKETDEFAQPIGQNSEVYQDDARNITEVNEYDMVITDPPYYHNVMYSELSDFFYVWQKVLLEDRYSGFDQNKTPRAGSIVTNPALDKSEEDFENEIGEALETIHRALKEDGALAFTYHHSDEESWGELLTSLCNAGFEVTATYPASSDLQKFMPCFASG
jgi:adenine-specific DNA methylase